MDLRGKPVSDEEVWSRLPAMAGAAPVLMYLSPSILKAGEASCQKPPVLFMPTWVILPEYLLLSMKPKS